MADPYGYDRPLVVDLTDNVNTFRRKVNQVSNDLGDKRRLLTDAGTSLASDSDIVGNLIELDYRINETSGDLYLRANGGSLYIQNGNTSTIAAEFLYDSAAGNLSLITPMSGDFTIDTVGDIIFDADGNDIRFKNGAGGDEVVHTLADDANYTITAPGDYLVNAVGDIDLSGGNFTTTATGDVLVDASGDITLSADGNDIVFDNGAGGDTVTHTLTDAGGYTVAQSGTGDYTVDVGGDIILDAAGDNIVFKDDGSTRITYTLGATTDIAMAGSLTTNVAGSILDSAGTSITQTAGTTFDQVSGGNFTTTVTGNVLVDATGDITLDADGNDVIFKNGAGGDTVTHTLADDANFTIASPADYTVDTVGDIILDADGNDIRFKNGAGGDEVVHTLNDDATYVITAPDNYEIDVVGDIILDADGNDIIFQNGAGGDEVTHTLADNADYTIVAPDDVIVDAVGDITLDADGNDIRFMNGAGGDEVVHTLADNSDYTITAPGNYVVDVQGSGDITLDAAGTNIFFDNDGNRRITYTLGATTDQFLGGNYTLNVDGSIADSAGTTYSLVAGTNITQTATTGSVTTTSGTTTSQTAGTTYTVVAGTNISQTATAGTTTHVSGTTTTHTVGTDYALTAGGNYTTDVDGSMADSADSLSRTATTTITDTASGAISQTAGGTFTQTSGGAFDVNTTGDITLNASGDINLDADGNQVNILNGAGGDTVAMNLNDDASFEIDAPSTFTIDAGGDIYLDAADSDIYFRRNGVDFIRYRMGTSDNASITELEVNQGDLYFDVVGDITLDADGGNVKIRDGGVTQFDFIAGTNKEIDVPSGDLTIDVAGDLNLDAAGQQINFVDATNTRMTFNLDTTPQLDVTGNYTVSGSGSIVQSSTTTQELTGTDITLDASNNIYLEADGDQIHLRAITADKFIFGVAASPTLDITGNYTETGSGFHVTKSGTYMKDSAATNYTLTANSNITQTALNGSITETAGTSISQTSGTTFTQTSGGNFATNVTGDVDIDASGSYSLRVDAAIVDSAGTTLTRTSNDNMTDQTIGGNYSMISSGNISGSAGASMIDSANAISRTATVSIDDVSLGTYSLTTGSAYTVSVTGDATIDASGDVILDADGNDIRFKNGAGGDEVVHTLADNAVYTIATPASIILDATADVILDADGADVIFRDAGVEAYKFTSDGTISRTGDVVVDVTGDITLDAAGDNIFLADAGTTRITYTLGATTDIASGPITNTITGDFTVDASGDIILDADGNDILFKNGAGGDTVTHTLADDATYEIAAPSTFTIDAGGDIIFDAGDSDIYFRRAGVDYIRYRMGTNVTSPNTTQVDVSQGDLYFDVTGDIDLDADGGNVRIRDAGTTQFNFIAGTNKEIDVPSGDLTIDVAGDITLNADGGLIRLYDGGTEFGRFTNTSGDLVVYSPQDNADIIFNGKDGGNIFTALTLDMSDSGSAIFNHDIYLPDNGIARFGDASDLQIYHTGGTSLVENALGTLVIRQNDPDNDVLIQSDNGSGSAVTNYFRADGSTTAAILYFGGSDRLTTTQDGVDVTGHLVADSATFAGPLDVNLGANGTYATLAGDNTSGTRGLQFTSSTNNGSIGAGHTINAQSINGEIVFEIGSTDAVTINRFRDVAFHDSVGADQNFYWDASTSRLGLGTTTPNQLLSINSTSAGERGISIDQSGSERVKLMYTNSSGAFVINNTTTGYTSFAINSGSEKARVDSDAFYFGTTTIAVGQGTGTGVSVRGPIGRIEASADGNTSGIFNRLNSNGRIVNYSKDGQTVGTLGVDANDNFYISSTAASHSGLYLSTNLIAPLQAETLTDNAIDLGNASYRFKDLYLSGVLTNDGTGGISVDTAGNVGIGTSSPAFSAASSGIEIEAASANPGIRFQRTTTNNSAFEVYAGADAGHVNVISSDPLVFSTVNTERLRITGDGDVGIGTTAPAGNLEINGGTGVATTGGTLIVRQRLDGDSSGIAITSSNAISHRIWKNANGALNIGPSTNPDAIISDTSGNLLVGTSISTPGIGNTTTGTAINPTFLAISRAPGVNSVLFLNRNTANGRIIDLSRDGALVGSIGTVSSDVYIGTGDTSIRMDNGNDAVHPAGSEGAQRSGAIDLGRSGHKWKDLWISGTANLPTVDIDAGSIVGCTEVGSAASPISSGEFNTLTVNTNLSVPGTISPSGIIFNDASALGGNRYDQAMTFGNDSDLAIYHDGSHSYIKDKGTGDLRLTTNAFGVRNSTDTQNMITAAEGGAVTLYHNNSAKLVTTSTGVTVTGLLTADTKSFTIDHPTKEGMKLRYGSLEGPEHGVYVRGRLNGENTIELPEVWLGLVDENTITVNLTPIGKGECWVEDIQNNTVTVGGHLNCFYMVLAERKDVEKLEVEFPADGS